MKKLSQCLILFSMMFLLFTQPVLAQQEKMTIDLNNKTITHNLVAFDIPTMKVQNGRLYLDGARDYIGVFEHDYEVYPAYINPYHFKFKDVTVEIGSDSPVITKNGEAIQLDNEELEQLKQGFIPVRTVFELQDLHVVYDKATNTIVIQ